MTPTWIKGVDGSFTELTPAIVQRLRLAGVAVWWQCLWTGSLRPKNAIPNLEVARAGGMIIAAYCSVTSANPGWWHANNAREGVPDDLWDALRVVPCDVELDGIPPATIRQCVDRLLELGKRRAIYTSFDAWKNKLGNPLEFADCLLCNALWDGDPDVDFGALPFGPWTVDQVLLEQYTGGADVEGVEVDHDVWNRELLFAVGSESSMDAPTKAEFGALFAYTVATHSAVVELVGAIATLAIHVYGDDEPRLAKLNADLDALRLELADKLNDASLNAVRGALTLTSTPAAPATEGGT